MGQEGRRQWVLLLPWFFPSNFFLRARREGTSSMEEIQEESVVDLCKHPSQILCQSSHQTIHTDCDPNTGRPLEEANLWFFWRSGWEGGVWSQSLLAHTASHSQWLCGHSLTVSSLSLCFPSFLAVPLERESVGDSKRGDWKFKVLRYTHSHQRWKCS